MFEELTEDGVIHMSEALEALSELEKNTSQAITAMRSSQRIDIRTKVWVQPGNSGDRSRFVMEGLTADISKGGCMILTPRPLMVGNSSGCDSRMMRSISTRYSYDACDVVWCGKMRSKSGFGS